MLVSCSGSCWAFATAGALESKMLIDNNLKVSSASDSTYWLSPQQLVRMHVPYVKQSAMFCYTRVMLSQVTCTSNWQDPDYYNSSSVGCDGGFPTIVSQCV